jgi:hypothetical protein
MYLLLLYYDFYSDLLKINLLSNVGIRMSFHTKQYLLFSK